MENEIEIGVTTITNVIEVTAQPNDQIVDIGVTDNTDEVVINVTPSVIEININKGGLNSNLVTSVNTKIGDVVLDKNDIGLGNVDNTADYDKMISLDTQIALNEKADLVDGVVPSYQLPSYVDDVLEVANYVSLPITGEIGKIYVTLDNNKMFRWTGSIYIEIASNSAIWGAITGTLSNQLDLKNALNLRVPYTGATSDVNLGANSLIIGYVENTNPSNLYVKGTTNTFISVETAGEKTSILTNGILLNDIQNGGSLKLNLRPSGLITGVNRNISFPNANGTVALTSDLHNPITIGTANGLSLSNQVLSLGLSSSTTNGALSSTDWNTFNNKLTLPTLTSGSVLFSNGTTIAQDNSQFFWDDINNRLGIGTKSPSAKLSIVGDMRLAGISGGYATGDNPMIGFGDTPSAGSFGTIEHPFGSYMKFNSYHGFDFKVANGGVSPVTALTITTNRAATFASSVTANGAGSFGLATTIGNGVASANSVLKLAGVVSVSYNWSIGNNGNLEFKSGYPITALTLSATTGAATFASSVTATAFYQTSDLRLKNIISRDGNVINFTWKDKRDELVHIGYVAQDIQKTNPDQIQEDKEGMLSVNYIEILVQKIQDLENRIKQLEK